MRLTDALGRNALRAPTVQHDFVRLELKSRWGEAGEIAGAAVDLKDAGALAAPKVMMMLGACALVARRFAGELDRDQPCRFDQGIDRAIDCGDPQPLHVLAARVENFERSQGTRNLLKDLPNGVALPRFAFHLSNMVPGKVAYRPCGAFDFAAMVQLASSPAQALRTPRQWLAFVALAVVCVSAAHVADEWAWRAWRDLKVNDRDWGRLLRSLGYLPTWLIIAGGVWLHDKGRAQWGWRGGLLLVAPIAGGATAEVLKMLVRRLRPDAETFGYVWRPFSEQLLSTKGLGMPSSHTMVAFAGAAALARVFPRGWWLWYVLAAGCAATRVLSLGHFLSDAVAAGFLGYAVGVVVARAGGFGRAVGKADAVM